VQINRSNEWIKEKAFEITQITMIETATKFMLTLLADIKFGEIKTKDEESRDAIKNLKRVLECDKRKGKESSLLSRI